MAFAASLAKLQEEASCSICLDYLGDPVTAECGHNFCSSCIHQRWDHLQSTFPCPVCLHHCPDRSLKRNTQLCHMTEIVPQIPTSGSQRKMQEEIPLCAKHNEVLTLFCEKSLELLCPQCSSCCAQCSVSSDHGDHPLMPTEEAAGTHRRKLKSYIKSFSKQIKDTENRSEMQVSKCFEVRQRIENVKDELDSEVKQLKNFLEKEQNAMLISLLTETTNVEEKLMEEKNQISNHSSILNSRVSDIISKCLQTDMELLTGIESIQNKYDNLEPPATFLYELKKESCSLPPHYLGLHKMIHTFQVDLTLDPETAHPCLIISRDRKSVTYRTAFGLRNLHGRTSYPAVLRSEGFDAGRHFWQVEVRGTGPWSLGVCKESFPKNAPMPPSPRNGCWQFQFWANTSDTWDSGNWERIGIFLDYELGEVSFYNLRNRSHLYTFSERFTVKLMPYFCIGLFTKSLEMRIVKDER
ncbi:PREDICTED: putative tripartite motif-containing protein 75 [Myotis davidii]|uniref:Tripartite motif-containing protein 60 n=1 Tax=Myotis davidii TaxID=225400 RepID=L5LGD6_MYODS|nr:PREDICTED: putative tripartite motif-containing protein 75 [Myotis davidii]ELK24703.1 Tripartite motif-containing protein 60 [Myotis davidii]